MRRNFGKNECPTFPLGRRRTFRPVCGVSAPRIRAIHGRAERGVWQKPGPNAHLRVAVLHAGRVRSVPLPRGRTNRRSSRSDVGGGSGGLGPHVWPRVGRAHPGAGVQVPRGISAEQRRRDGPKRPRFQHRRHGQTGGQQDVSVRFGRPQAGASRRARGVGAHLVSANAVRRRLEPKPAKWQRHSNAGLDGRGRRAVRGTRAGRGVHGHGAGRMPARAGDAARPRDGRRSRNSRTGRLGLRGGRVRTSRRGQRVVHDAHHAKRRRRFSVGHRLVPARPDAGGPKPPPSASPEVLRGRPSRMGHAKGTSPSASVRRPRRAHVVATALRIPTVRAVARRNHLGLHHERTRTAPRGNLGPCHRDPNLARRDWPPAGPVGRRPGAAFGLAPGRTALGLLVGRAGRTPHGPAGHGNRRGDAS